MDRAIELSEAGYWVFPLFDHKKGATVIGGRTWGWYLDAGEKSLLHGYLRTAIANNDATGAAICPQPGDPRALLILDVDNYSDDYETIWRGLAGDGAEALPDSAGLVRSASGGFHFWFALPDSVDAKRVPLTYDLGAGISGEVRRSGPGKSLAVLPGSKTFTKIEGAATGRYKEVQPIHWKNLPPPPDTLLARLLARSGQGTGSPGIAERDREGVPTEFAHFTELLGHIPTLPKGEQNILIARMGQILGRMYPVDRFPESMRTILVDLLKDKVTDWKEHEIIKALNSGFKTGRENAGKYAKRDAHPTVTDVMAECEALFGSMPWLKTLKGSTGKAEGYVIGLGGSPKRPEEVESEVRIPDLKQLLPAVTRLSAAREDEVVRSPLFIQPGWGRALEFTLSKNSVIERLGIPPEEKFWSTVDQWAHVAARDGNYIENWTDPRPDRFRYAPFYVWPMTEEPACLVLPQSCEEQLLMNSGDIPSARQLLRANFLKKGLRGMKGGNKISALPLTLLSEGAQQSARQGYEQHIARKLGEANGNT